MTQWEHEVATLWAGLLGRDPSAISVEADFFQLGGDSLVFVQFLIAAQERFSVEIMVDELYESGFTVRAVAEVLSSGAGVA
ncbi:acyl carrier protein [Nonomuraea sp. KC401]|uniref:acyl carrier protein n=1 Tax=unclassified Nonomuraea TaxID=2593643 RepID=UPI0010FE6335|nr:MULTISPECIES: acyl carrier protein [unclassified Nonomuraea]NBE98016.1 hypothetical protein [Nonomuraea sp. K271]TLF60032.1 acyl carrier protein [Nonomuraea sp. KC401]